ncbi:MAG: type II/IV secretion system ATPase subunit [Candidatus Hodarchaeales archaeon]|jgi:flagellar protein FlaI
MAIEESLVRESYPLVPPFAYALIQMDAKTKEIVYSVMEAPLTSKEQEILSYLEKNIVTSLDRLIGDFVPKKKKEIEPADIVELQKDYLKGKMKKLIKSNRKYKVDDGTFEKLLYHVSRDLLGFGIIDPLLRDHNIEDISCDGTRVPLYVWHREYESIKTNLRFETDKELDNFVIKVAQRSGRHISVANPLLDSALPDGSRINCTYSNEVTMRGSTFTIRKFKEDPLTIVDMINYNTIDENIASFYWYALENQKSILIAGGTASGKTSLLNSLAMFIKPGAKIVSIEDTPELNIPHDNWIPAIARQGFGGYNTDGSRRGEVNMYDLLRAAVRQRPDFLFVGEVRGSEAYTLFQAMATGHTGMGTIHGDSAQGIIRRLESEPMNIPRALIQSLNIIAVQRRVRREQKHLRRTVEVVEVIEVDQLNEDLVTNKIFQWDGAEDAFVSFGKSYVLNSISDFYGMGETQLEDELENRKTVLRWLVKTKRRSYKDVAEAVLNYYNDPYSTIDRAKRELRRV